MPQFKHHLKLKILLGHLARPHWSQLTDFQYRNLILWYLNVNKKGKTIKKAKFFKFCIVNWLKSRGV